MVKIKPLKQNRIKKWLWLSAHYLTIAEFPTVVYSCSLSTLPPSQVAGASHYVFHTTPGNRNKTLLGCSPLFFQPSFSARLLIAIGYIIRHHPQLSMNNAKHWKESIRGERVISLKPEELELTQIERIMRDGNSAMIRWPLFRSGGRQSFPVWMKSSHSLS